MIQNDLLTPTRRRSVPPIALEHILRDVARRVPELHWATISSPNGVIQATYDPFQKEQPDRILAIASAVLSLGERAFHKLQHGRLTHLTLAGDAGVLVVRPVGEEYILAISIPPSVEVAAAVDALAQAARALRPQFHSEA
ncbi:MAG: roadblock/LC7 domain-containing protein [Anaerolineae bacterium]|nr:roadblock/LC7 domain-containing protein [Anaerolineae bacterium]